jgi:xylulokinase
MKNYLLGYDIGSSSVKVSIIDSDTGELVSSAFSPKKEMKIDSPEEGWAEQYPATWWEHLLTANKRAISELPNSNYKISAIGISYQMHGLVMLDRNKHVLYPSIIWCDSRAVEIGDKAFSDLGQGYCLSNCLNSPGNFTASKLKWIKDNEPKVYDKIDKIMLPGDYIAFKLTNEINTTISGLSEGIFWDFKKNNLADYVFDYYSIDKSFIPEIVPTFSVQGRLTEKAAKELGLEVGIPISYRAGDQPNNAFSLNVLNSGEIAATAGTSGVIYGIVEENTYDSQSRVNNFAHVNYTINSPIKGVLLCINGTGILYNWLKNELLKSDDSYETLNVEASKIDIGSGGVTILPFGNGAERILANKNFGGQILGINFNKHSRAHILRAAQEGIVFSFRYGIDIMKQMGISVNLMRAGKANMFLSSIFSETIANTTGAMVELYNTDGAQGAARGAGIGAGVYNSYSEAFDGLRKIETILPREDLVIRYNDAYENWKQKLELFINEEIK